MSTLGLADLVLGDIVLGGAAMSADITAAVVDEPDLVRTIDGASTLTISVSDYKRVLVNSALFGQRTPLVIDGLGFELVAVKKTEDVLELTFEDLAVASLRKHKGLLLATSETQTRAEFVRRLVGEEPWLRVEGPAGPAAKEQLSRGRPIAAGTDETPAKLKKEDDEDSWAAITRIAEEVQWRVFTVGRTVYYAPDSWLMARPVIATLREFAAGVDGIDFDYDVGKAEITATVNCRVERWAVAPGELVEVTGLGPANGPWIVSEIRRPLLSQTAEVQLVQPRPELPEPDGQAGAGSGELPPLSDGLPDPTAVPTAAPVGPKTKSAAKLAKPPAPEVFAPRTADAFVEQLRSQMALAIYVNAVDMAQLIQWAAHRCAVAVPDNVGDLYGVCKTSATFTSPETAVITAGTLLFSGPGPKTMGPNLQVLVSLGDGTAVEVVAGKFVTNSIKNRSFVQAAFVPGLSYATPVRRGTLS